MANHQLQINVGTISSAFASVLQLVANVNVGAYSSNVSANAVVLPSTSSPQPDTEVKDTALVFGVVCPLLPVSG